MLFRYWYGYRQRRGSFDILWWRIGYCQFGRLLFVLLLLSHLKHSHRLFLLFEKLLLLLLVFECLLLLILDHLFLIFLHLQTLNLFLSHFLFILVLWVDTYRLRWWNHLWWLVLRLRALDLPARLEWLHILLAINLLHSGRIVSLLGTIRCVLRNTVCCHKLSVPLFNPSLVVLIGSNVGR